MSDKPDVVAELDAWLRQPAYEEGPRPAMADTAPLIFRARDEIVALRIRNDLLTAWLKSIDKAAVVEAITGVDQKVAAIRALKDKP